MKITYKDEVFTNQIVFDRVWEKFVVNKTPIDNPENGANYTHLPNGCFIGCLLTKSFARKLQQACDEHKIYSITSILTKKNSDELFKQVAELFNNCHVEFLETLQTTHDKIQVDINQTSKLKNQLRELAENFCLTIPEENHVH